MICGPWKGYLDLGSRACTAINHCNPIVSSCNFGYVQAVIQARLFSCFGHWIWTCIPREHTFTPAVMR